MESVRDLLSTGRPLTGSVGVHTATVPTDDLDVWVCLEPFGQTRGGSVRKQVDDPVPLEVHQDRPVALTPAECPIVNADDTDGRIVSDTGGVFTALGGRFAHAPEQGVGAGRQAKVGCNAGAGFSAKRITQERDR
jgi:hypothetical protein